MRIARSLALLATFSTAGVTFAQPAVLRLACDGDSQGAEVSVNGKAIGDCPLDSQVQPGTIRITALKKVDAQRERIFEAEFKLGPGTAKRVQIELGPVGPNAEGRRQAAIEEEQAWTKATSARTAPAYRAYLASFPQGKRAADAKVALSTFPARPSFPVPVDPAVLDRLEGSEAFAEMQRSRAFQVDFDTTLKFPDGGGARSTSSMRHSQLAAGYVKASGRSTSDYGTFKVATDDVRVTALAGLVEVAGTRRSGQDSWSSKLVSIPEISGSLVPARAGAQLRVRYKTIHGNDQTAATVASTWDTLCVMSASVDASTLNPRLAGKAWPVECTRVDAGEPVSKMPANTSKRHYLDDYYIFTDAIGTGGVAGIVPIPVAGSKFDTGNGELTVNRFDVTFE